MATPQARAGEHQLKIKTTQRSVAPSETRTSKNSTSDLAGQVLMLKLIAEPTKGQEYDMLSGSVMECRGGEKLDPTIHNDVEIQSSSVIESYQSSQECDFGPRN